MLNKYFLKGLMTCGVHVFLMFYVADIELGLKRDALVGVDGSSLEALLKGEPVERRSGASDLRGTEEELATVEPPASVTSGRIRKVSRKKIYFNMSSPV